MNKAFAEKTIRNELQLTFNTPSERAAKIAKHLTDTLSDGGLYFSRGQEESFVACDQVKQDTRPHQ